MKSSFFIIPSFFLHRSTELQPWLEVPIPIWWKNSVTSKLKIRTSEKVQIKQCLHHPKFSIPFFYVLFSVTEDLKNLVIKLEGRVAALEGKGSSSAPAPKAAAKKEEPEEDDDVDLFGSGSESEDDEEKARVREERLAAYHAKKANKPKVIAKTSVVLDIKPWDDETDMDAMLKNVKTITKEGLVWGACKYTNNLLSFFS